MTKNEFTKEYNNNKAYFKYYAYKICLNKDDTEDLLQDTVVRCLSNLESYDNTKGYFKSWFIKIMININIDKYRKSLRTPNSVDINDISDSIEDSTISKIDNIDIELMYKMIRSYHDKKSVDIFLKVIERYQIKDIADEYGMKEGTVKSITFRIRKFLQNKILNSEFKDLVIKYIKDDIPENPINNIFDNKV
jgi:RNA polymerase sigma-70 factor (ECF subfamily)